MTAALTITTRTHQKVRNGLAPYWRRVKERSLKGHLKSTQSLVGRSVVKRGSCSLARSSTIPLLRGRPELSTLSKTNTVYSFSWPLTSSPKDPFLKITMPHKRHFGQKYGALDPLLPSILCTLVKIMTIQDDTLSKIRRTLLCSLLIIQKKPPFSGANTKKILMYCKIYNISGGSIISSKYICSVMENKPRFINI